MSTYRIARTLYRATDRAVLGRLPARLEWRVRALIVRVARRVFPGRIEARSAGELAASSANRHGAVLPAWAVDEVRELTALEPALHMLLDGSTALEAYVIPWDATYVGKRYAAARRQLDTDFGAFVVHDGVSLPAAADLARLACPLAVIDVTSDAAAGPLAARLGARHVWLPAEYLDRNDHCAVLARLVLQCSPGEVAYADGGLAEACVDRHGLAMRSVSTLRRLGKNASDVSAM
jgi:hypothetical protein